jgi:hypothetical protein
LRSERTPIPGIFDRFFKVTNKNTHPILESPKSYNIHPINPCSATKKEKKKKNPSYRKPGAQSSSGASTSMA